MRMHKNPLRNQLLHSRARKRPFTLNSTRYNNFHRLPKEIYRINFVALHSPTDTKIGTWVNANNHANAANRASHESQNARNAQPLGLYRPSIALGFVVRSERISRISSPSPGPSSFSSPSFARRSISSFLEQSQMAFLLMLATGCTLTLEGEKSAYSKAGENFMDCAMATGFCSKRTLGPPPSLFTFPFTFGLLLLLFHLLPFFTLLFSLLHPFLVPPDSFAPFSLRSTPLQSPRDSFITTSIRVHASRDDYWLRWRIRRRISSSGQNEKLFPLSAALDRFSFVCSQ